MMRPSGRVPEVIVVTVRLAPVSVIVLSPMSATLGAAAVRTVGST